MATVKNNALIEGISGAMDGIIFKQYHGRTLATRRPARPQQQSERQRDNRAKFREASRWAKAVLQDPERKAYYLKKAKKLKLPNAYTAAIADYMRPVHINPVHNSPTHKTFFAAKKSFGVAKIHIMTFEETGIETGRRVTTDEFVSLTMEELRQRTVIAAEDDCGILYTYYV